MPNSTFIVAASYLRIISPRCSSGYPGTTRVDTSDVEPPLVVGKVVADWVVEGIHGLPRCWAIAPDPSRNVGHWATQGEPSQGDSAHNPSKAHPSSSRVNARASPG